MSGAHPRTPCRSSVRSRRGRSVPPASLIMEPDIRSQMLAPLRDTVLFCILNRRYRYAQPPAQGWRPCRGAPDLVPKLKPPTNAVDTNPISSFILSALLGFVVASTQAADDQPLAALGGRCSTNDAGEVVSVDLSNSWL